MGLLDNLRDRLRGDVDDYDDDDYYDDDYDDDDYDDEPTGSGLLGNTPRPEAESVAVYTRSGRPVGTNAGAPMQESSARQTASTRPADSYSSYARSSRDDYDKAPSPSTPASRAASFNASGQLPPYVLRAEEYEDVQAVVRRVRTNQPVLLVLTDTPSDIAQRILDFCFGLSFGLDGEVQAVSDRAFVVLPKDIQLSPAELDRLAAEAR